MENPAFREQETIDWLNNREDPIDEQDETDEQELYQRSVQDESSFMMEDVDQAPYGVATYEESLK